MVKQLSLLGYGAASIKNRLFHCTLWLSSGLMPENGEIHLKVLSRRPHQPLAVMRYFASGKAPQHDISRATR
jgi:hypothetical protein